jgi:hypothetical protein
MEFTTTREAKMVEGRITFNGYARTGINRSDAVCAFCEKGLKQGEPVLKLYRHDKRFVGYAHTTHAALVEIKS